jgi:hypothetical protein
VNTLYALNPQSHSQTPSFGAKSGISWYKRFEDKFIEKVFKILPNDIKLKESTIFNKAGNLKTYHNRLIIGLFAFATQPWIDLFNPDVDSETRKMSWLRTMAKIIIGTATGVGVRLACINYILPKFTKVADELANTKNKKSATLFMPSSEKAIEMLTKSKSLLTQHRNVIGTFIAIAAMMITDPPLTVFLTNFFKKLKERKSSEIAQNKAKNPQNTNLKKEVDNV